MDPRATADLLKSWALEAGFDRAGVARLGPLEHGEALVRWLDRGDQAGMEYLGRRLEARLDPSQVFPGARSVLCVALQYHPLYREEGERQPEPCGTSGGGSRYARGGTITRSWASGSRILEERIRAGVPRLRDAALRGHRAGPRARAGGAGGDRGGGEEHDAAPPGGGLLVPARRAVPRASTSPPDQPLDRPLRELHPLPRRLPDGRARRALPAGQQPLHLLLDDRAPRAAPRRGAADGGGLGLRLRRLPGGLPWNAGGGRAPSIRRWSCRRSAAS